MRVKLTLVILLAIGLLFIPGCASEEIKPEPKLYILEEPWEKIFVIGEHNPIGWADAARLERHELNRQRALRDYKDDIEEFEVKSRYKRVVRSSDGNTVFGYLKEADNPGFEEIK